MANAVRNSSDHYTGPSVREMRTEHTMADNIISRHNDACPIFDDAEILRLRQFVTSPDKAADIMREHGLTYASGQRGASGLTACIMGTWGTEESFLTEGEVEELRKWFESGGGRTDAEVAAAKGETQA